VRDLQQRLASTGHPVTGDPPGRYGAATTDAVKSFQAARRLRVDGICGPQTWAALVESGFQLGDRMLYLRTPHLRGDDIAELQSRLNALGFDAGREDGIFGPQTARALTEFQRNCGVAVDGILGPDTLAALERVRSLAAGSVASVRERDRLEREPVSLTRRRIYLAVGPGIEMLGIAARSALSSHGAHVITDLEGGDDARVIERANGFEADLCLVLHPSDEPGPCRIHFFESPRYRSETGSRLAHGLASALTDVYRSVDVSGHAFPVLRETRMPTVVIETPVGDPDTAGRLAERAPLIARRIADGLRQAIEVAVHAR